MTSFTETLIYDWTTKNTSADLRDIGQIFKLFRCKMFSRNLVKLKGIHKSFPTTWELIALNEPIINLKGIIYRWKASYEKTSRLRIAEIDDKAFKSWPFKRNLANDITRRQKVREICLIS